MNIWFTSDTHYHHKNIVRGTTDWANDPSKGAASVQRTRDFDTLEEHNDALVKNINDKVGENDILYHLGDWSFGGLEYVWEFRRRLRCKNIHLILGNHDHHIERNRVLPNCHWDTENGIIIDGPSKHPHIPVYNVRTHDLFSSVQHYKSDKIGGQSMTLMHYAMRTWEKAHHGTWMLHGHSHGTLPDYTSTIRERADNGPMVDWPITFRTMDVGVDTHKEFRPYHIDELRGIMSTRVPLLVDHHTKDTN